MTAPAGIHPTFIEALAAHELFRKQGYPADDIYVRPQGFRFYVILRHRGRDFAVDAGPLDMSDEDIKVKWPAAVTWWNANTNGATKEVFETTGMRREAVQILAAMVAQGFPKAR